MSANGCSINHPLTLTAFKFMVQLQIQLKIFFLNHHLMSRSVHNYLFSTFMVCWLALDTISLTSRLPFSTIRKQILNGLRLGFCLIIEFWIKRWYLYSCRRSPEMEDRHLLQESRQLRKLWGGARECPSRISE